MNSFISICFHNSFKYFCFLIKTFQLSVKMVDGSLECMRESDLFSFIS